MLALELTVLHNLPAAYDAHYVALAEQLACAFWTDDQRLLHTLGGVLPAVRAPPASRLPEAGTAAVKKLPAIAYAGCKNCEPGDRRSGESMHQLTVNELRNRAPMTDGEVAEALAALDALATLREELAVRYGSDPTWRGAAEEIRQMREERTRQLEELNNTRLPSA